MTGPAFRHDPVRTVLPLSPSPTPQVRWTTEPAVCGYVQLAHRDTRTGADIPVPVCASPVAVPGVGVVVGTYDGRVRFYERSLAKVYWERQVGGPVYAPLVADHVRRRVVVSTTYGHVAALDLRGLFAWQVETGSAVHAAPAVVPAADLLVVATFGSRCLGLDLATGEVRFTRDLPRPWHAAYGGSAAARDAYASPVSTEDGGVVVACAEHVLCLEPDGSVRWQHEIGHAVKASPAVLGGRGLVAVCSVNGQCLLLDTASGQPRGAVDLGGKVVASPAVSGDFLVVGTQDGTAHGIDVTAPRLAWRAAGYAPREYTSFTVLPDGDFAAVTAGGNAVGLRRADGRFLWETSQLLGLAEHDPAMDVTPVVSPDGSMYCGSYSGVLYHHRFRPTADEEQR
ncbi:outer membrane protein assembly factor BamB [Actinokineospora baliensis]|uniref:outer membrane protein assembly factor BamB family protein n=1 Tax=Actinokineospora baliensis TaxID=547056 RepID=UPI00195B2D41|nr:PQQ-binding-like beta-propeller repeat protein [Actinokineospora baliensis]MBM7771686.1 outer membrane protein assembly factor BamB [Actinokineospora baliensis]